jgi:P27 family predicted phage terminase small subunit
LLAHPILQFYSFKKMKGRKPIPTHMKLIKGTSRPCRVNSDEPSYAADEIAPPEWLDGLALEHWEKLCREMRSAGVMTNIDIDALAAYCVTYARWREANERLKKSLVIESAAGQEIPSPYIAIANKAFEHMTKMLVEFGMTPSSRARVKATPLKAKNKFSDHA